MKTHSFSALLAGTLAASGLVLTLSACDKPTPDPQTAASTADPAPATPAESQPSDEPQTRADWELIERDAMHEATQAQLDKGLRAQKELGKLLLEALSQSIESDGYEKSIAFCRGAAPELAENVGKKWGVEIGRTSHRLRNPKNTPPHWADAFVTEQRKEQAFVLGPHGELGILSPIQTAELCTNCHGASGALAPGVESALKEAYPEDAATGFAAGDLRGWFWVEVPPPS